MDIELADVHLALAGLRIVEDIHWRPSLLPFAAIDAPAFAHGHDAAGDDLLGVFHALFIGLVRLTMRTAIAIRARRDDRDALPHRHVANTAELPALDGGRLAIAEQRPKLDDDVVEIALP